MSKYIKPEAATIEIDVETTIMRCSGEPEDGAGVGGGTSDGWD